MNLNTFINKFEHFTFTGQNIKDILNDEPVKIIDYNELNNYTSLDAAFGDNRCLILLLTRSSDIKHWVTLLIKNNLIEYYDPYGFPLVFDLKLSTYDNPNVLPNLIQLKLNQGFTFQQNGVRLQKLVKDMNTCGAHSVCRCLFYTLTNEQYTNMMISYTKVEPDELVVLMLTSYLIKLVE